MRRIAVLAIVAGFGILASAQSDEGREDRGDNQVFLSGALTVESSPEWKNAWRHPGTPLNAARVTDETGNWASVARLSLRSVQGWSEPGFGPVLTFQGQHPTEPGDRDMLHIVAEWNEAGGVDMVFVGRTPSGEYSELLRLRAE